MGPLAVHEAELARRLFSCLHAGMLLLADRGFYGFDLWRQGASQVVSSVALSVVIGRPTVPR
jgi:hypothetical protein